MIWIKKEQANAAVTDYYLETIGCAFEELGCKVVFADNLSKITPKEDDIVVVSTAPDVLRMWINCKRIIFWAQGVWPEESLMRNGSKLRFVIASWIEKFALKKAEYVFFVSYAMKEFYENKYSLNFDNRYYIMPCANETFHAESFQTRDKYTGNIFCYVGGISVWQCFEETISLYQKIEKKHGNTKLLLLVRERDKALEYLRKYNVQNFEIDYVSVAQLPDVLKQVKFGFVIREPSAVNDVATPTKMLTYLANGIIPIYSDCLKGMKAILQDSCYAIPYANNGDVSQIEKMMISSIDHKEVLKEYEHIYKTHYSRSVHQSQIKTLFWKNRQF